MENLYLAKAVGKPLTMCLAELTDKMPQDPIEWIAHWLYKFADNEIYFYEKSLLLKEMHKMRLELEREKELRQKRLKELNAQIAGMKQEVGEVKQTLSQMLAESARRGKGKGFGGMGGEDGRMGSRIGRSGSQRSSRAGSARSRSGRAGDLYGDGRRSKGSRADDMYHGDVPAHLVGTSTWRLDCKLGLICRHSILGEMRGRPPFVCPETPEWWEKQNYLPETLYDHEIYSRDNDDPYPDWDNMQHLTYKDFVDAGPWLQDKALVGMQESLQEMYRMPDSDG